MSIQTQNLPDNPHIEVIKSGETGLFTNYIFKAIPLAFDESLSYYECLCGLLDYLKNTIIPTVNNNADAVAELQNLYVELKTYVDNYFTNLDVQEEINNKLDAMVESGTLQEIIASYLNSKAIFGFDNVASMKSATNLINGSYAQTYGFYNKNDGGNALYKIRNITNDDIVDNMFIIPMQNENLIAELLVDDLYVEQLGAKGNGIDNDTTILQNAINYCINKQITLKSRGGKTFLITSSLNFNNKIDIDFNNSTIKTNTAIDMLVFNYLSGNDYQGFLKNIVIDMNNIATKGIYIIRSVKKLISAITIKNISNIGYQIDDGYEIIFEKSHLYGSANTSIGLQLNDSDCHYTDLIMIDVHTGIVAGASNFFTRIHAWMLTRSFIPNSKFMRCTSGSTSFLNQCYSDTYHYSFYLENSHRIKLTEHYNYNNQNIMNSDVITACGGMIYMFYFTDPSYSAGVSITNSHIMGLPNNNEHASFTNLQQNEILSYCDYNTRTVNFVKNFKANEIPITTLLDDNFSLSSSYANQISRISGIVDLNIRLQASNYIEGANQELTVYNLPQQFRPITETSMLLPVTDSSYNLKTYIFGYIATGGNVNIRIPTGTNINSNDRIHLNKSFITVSSQP